MPAIICFLVLFYADKLSRFPFFIEHHNLWTILNLFFLHVRIIGTDHPVPLCHCHSSIHINFISCQQIVHADFIHSSRTRRSSHITKHDSSGVPTCHSHIMIRNSIHIPSIHQHLFRCLTNIFYTLAFDCFFPKLITSTIHLCLIYRFQILIQNHRSRQMLFLHIFLQASTRNPIRIVLQISA